MNACGPSPGFEGYGERRLRPAGSQTSTPSWRAGAAPPWGGYHVPGALIDI